MRQSWACRVAWFPFLRAGRVLLDYALDSSLVLGAVFLKQIIRLGLSGGFGVRGVEKILNAQRDLLYRDSGLPSLFLVEDR